MIMVYVGTVSKVFINQKKLIFVEIFSEYNFLFFWNFMVCFNLLDFVLWFKIDLTHSQGDISYQKIIIQTK
jgi:hypothetical protein